MQRRAIPIVPCSLAGIVLVCCGQEVATETASETGSGGTASDTGSGAPSTTESPDGSSDDTQSESPRVVALSSGGVQTCAVVDTTLHCWGAKWPEEGFPSPGMMTPGDAEALGMRTPQGDGYIDVSVGWSHGCALREDGTAQCWSPADSMEEAQSCCAAGLEAPDVQFSAIVAGPFQGACGLDLDGLLWCWSLSEVRSYPELGPGTQASAMGCVLDAEGMAHCASLDGGPFTELAASATCGLRPDGRVECLGEEAFVEVPDAGPFTAIAANDDTLCGVGEDRTIRCHRLDPLAELPVVPSGGEFARVTIGVSWDYVAVACGVTVDDHIICGDDGAWDQGRVPDDL